MPDKCILNPETDCIGKMKAEKVEEKLDDLIHENRESHKRFGERLDVLERHDAVRTERDVRILEKLDDLGKGVKELTDDVKETTQKIPMVEHRVEKLEVSVESNKHDVDELQEKPGKRWETIVGQIIGLVVAAVVGLVLAKIGLGF